MSLRSWCRGCGCRGCGSWSRRRRGSGGAACESIFVLIQATEMQLTVLESLS